MLNKPSIALGLLLGLVGVTSSQAQGYRHFCNRYNNCFVCLRGSPTCEFAYASTRAMTPPTMPDVHRMLPPSPSPNPGPMFPERQYRVEPGSGAARPPPTAQQLPPRPQLNEEQWRQAIIDEAQKFCEAYPRDTQCHWKEPPPQ